MAGEGGENCKKESGNMARVVSERKGKKDRTKGLSQVKVRERVSVLVGEGSGIYDGSVCVRERERERWRR